MADPIDQANDVAASERDRGIAAARAASAIPEAVLGDCDACCDEDVMVRQCGGMPRCTPCRARWEKRR
jgi:hypothetical protein